MPSVKRKRSSNPGPTKGVKRAREVPTPSSTAVQAALDSFSLPERAPPSPQAITIAADSLFRALVLDVNLEHPDLLPSDWLPSSSAAPSPSDGSSRATRARPTATTTPREVPSTRTPSMSSRVTPARTTRHSATPQSQPSASRKTRRTSDRSRAHGTAAMARTVTEDDKHDTGDVGDVDEEELRSGYAMEVEDSVLDQGQGGSDMESDAIARARRIRRARLPWWRANENKITVAAKPSNEGELIQGYIAAIARACINATWTEEGLSSAFDSDPSCERGRAFRSVSSTLLMMERARHIGQCRLRWPRELLHALQARRDVSWSPLYEDGVSRKNGSFVGCEACRGFRPATTRLVICGPAYDARNFWPGQLRVDVLRTKAKGSIVDVTMELSPHGDELGDGSELESIEVWVDTECLRKCVVFHKLVHMSASIAGEVDGMMEDVLRDGVIRVDMSGEGGGKKFKARVLEQAELTVVDRLLENDDYLQKKRAFVRDLLRIGDIYFSAGESELLDSGDAADSPSGKMAHNIYDAPLELGDEMYSERVNKVLAMTRAH